MTRAFHAGSTGSNPVRGTTCKTQENDGGTDHSAAIVLPSRRVVGPLLIGVATVLIVMLGWTSAAHAQPSPAWESAEASYYLLHGNRTSCGKTASADAWFVASLKPDTANCGRKVTICRGSRCVRVTVQDRGAWRRDSRRWDLQVRVRDALRCPDVCSVKWKRGWAA